MFDQAKAEQILKRVASGDTISAACKSEQFPRQTWYDWQESNPDFRTAVARAVDIGSEALEDRTAEIEQRVLDGDLDASAAYTVLRNIHWRTSIRTPRKYNPKQTVEHTGPNGGDLFAGLAKAELLAELARRMSTPEIARALAGTLPALVGTVTKPDTVK